MKTAYQIVSVSCFTSILMVTLQNVANMHIKAIGNAIKIRLL